MTENENYETLNKTIENILQDKKRSQVEMKIVRPMMIEILIDMSQGQGDFLQTVYLQLETLSLQCQKVGVQLLNYLQDHH